MAHDALHALVGLLDVDEPIVIVMRHDPHPAAQRLLVSLGAGWIVDPDNGVPCAKACGRKECRVVARTESPQMRRIRENEERRRGAPEPTDDERTGMECKVEGCTGDASGAPRAGSHARLCARHRELRSAEMSAARKGRPRGDVAARKAVRPPPAVTANGSHVSKAERLLAAARAVDDCEAQLEQARTVLKEAVEALA